MVEQTKSRLEGGCEGCVCEGLEAGWDGPEPAVCRVRSVIIEELEDLRVLQDERLELCREDRPGPLLLASYFSPLFGKISQRERHVNRASLGGGLARGSREKQSGRHRLPSHVCGQSRQDALVGGNVGVGEEFEGRQHFVVEELRSTLADLGAVGADHIPQDGCCTLLDQPVGCCNFCCLPQDRDIVVECLDKLESLRPLQGWAVVEERRAVPQVGHLVLSLRSIAQKDMG